MWARKRQMRAKARGKGIGSMVTSGGRQENSLRTVRYISRVLYTNTGWSVHSPLGPALRQKRVQSIHIWYKGNESAVWRSLNRLRRSTAHYCALSHLSLSNGIRPSDR